MSISQLYLELLNRKHELPEDYQQFIPPETPLEADMSDTDSVKKLHNEGIHSNVRTKTLHSCLTPTFSLQKYSEGSPIILVFCQPAEELKKNYPYVPVSYCSWLESAGARCIPVPWNLTQNTMDYLVEHANGLLVPGGNSNLYKVYNTKEGVGNVTAGFRKLWRYVTKQWQRGVHFPVWGTCLGFQLVLLMMSGDMKILNPLNSKNHTLDIFSYYDQSEILKNMPLNMRVNLENKKLLNFAHMNGISMNGFMVDDKSEQLRKELKLISVAKDKEGRWFCSFLEGRNHPVFISQFHPEKQSYEWNPDAVINHGYESIELSQFLANQFVEQCRRNKSRFPTKEQEAFNQIYNYIPQFENSRYFQVYFIDYKFRKSKETKNPRTSLKPKAISTGSKAIK